MEKSRIGRVHNKKLSRNQEKLKIKHRWWRKKASFPKWNLSSTLKSEKKDDKVKESERKNSMTIFER